MIRVGSYSFKRAETEKELEEIHALNYRTFVHEIAQHPDAGGGRLIDKFHDKNAYFIVVHRGRVVGMVSGHDQPPFSIADRLSDPSLLTAPGSRPLEVRLLAIEPAKRSSTVFFGLLWSLYHHAQNEGYTHLYISGLKERTRLYRRLGFEALGPAVPCGNASFVPMVLKVGQLPRRVQRVKRLWEMHVDRVQPSEREPVCLLPGPVTTAPAVQEAFQQPPIYHRGPEFIALFQKVRQTLARMTGARAVALTNGSGTLANEIVAATLASEPTRSRGLLLVNGEFGERLARQATRFGLEPRVLRWPWGQPWDLDDVRAVLTEQPADWIWGVHLESSTGVLNDLPRLIGLAQAHGSRVCVDCISSLGAVPIDLQHVYLATAATGKSLGAFAGIAIVFADPQEASGLDVSRVPSYLDLAAALASEGPRYTFPSPTLLALDAALAEYATPARARARYDHYAAMGAYVRRQLRDLGLEPLAGEAAACPVVTTFAPPAEMSAEEFVARCRVWGFAIGGQSGYLAERRLVQIATMGAVNRDDFASLFDCLRGSLTKSAAVLAGIG